MAKNTLPDSKAQKPAEVKLVLDVDYTEFMADGQKQFVTDVASALRCSPYEITDVVYRSGCVTAKFKIREDLALALVAFINDFKPTNSHTDVEKIKDFVEKYKVVDAMKTGTVDVEFTARNECSGDAVLFIHGWSGDDDSFGKLPEYVSKACNCPAYIYSYPSGVWKHSPSIVFIANALRNSILNAFPDKRLAIVAHSMGGLILRQLLVTEARSKSRIDMYVDNITFMASPHAGAVYAAIASKIPLGINSEQISDLKPNSPVLYQLNIDWGSWVSDYSDRCKISSIFGTADAIVPPSNAIGNSEEVVPILGRTHIDLVKPQGPNDNVVLTVLRFLKQSGFTKAGGGGEAAVTLIS